MLMILQKTYIQACGHNRLSDDKLRLRIQKKTTRLEGQIESTRCT